MCYDFSSHFIFKITHFKDFRSFISASDSLIYDVYAIISIINTDICFNIKYIITIYFFFHSLYSHTNTHKCALIFSQHLPISILSRHQRIPSSSLKIYRIYGVYM